MHRLTIIVPCYNSADTLSDLLDSILKETDDSQIIVVDDNSTEKKELFEEIKKAYDRKVVFLKNDSGIKGAGAARNVGLKAADGDYLMFADADDHFLTGWKRAVDGYIDSDADLVVFNPTSWDVLQDKEGYCTRQFSAEVMKAVNGEPKGDLYVRYLFTPVWSKLIKRKIVSDNKILFQETMFSNDVMFSMKSSFFAKTAVADSRKIYCVVEKPGTLTKRNSDESFSIRFGVFKDRLTFLQSNLGAEDYSFLADNINIDWFINILYENNVNRVLRKEYFDFCRKSGIPVERFIQEYRKKRLKQKYGPTLAKIKHRLLRK